MTECWSLEPGHWLCGIGSLTSEEVPAAGVEFMRGLKEGGSESGGTENQRHLYCWIHLLPPH